MNILNIVSAKIWGGGEQYVYDISVILSKKRIDSYILLDKKSQDLGRKFLGVTRVFFCDLNNFSWLKSLKFIFMILVKQKIDIINCHSGKMLPLCLLIKKIKKVKIVLFKHNATLSKHDLWHRYVRHNIDAVVCVSSLVYDLQTRDLTSEEKDKYVLIQNGINFERFNKYSILKKNSSKFILGYAGRIVENKGIYLLLDVVKELSKKYDNIEVHIVGSGDKPNLIRLKQYINDNSLQSIVKYYGIEHDMERFYKSIDILVVPSIVKEAFGLVICESMYCGTPVITSDSGAQKEIIVDGINGFIVSDIKNNLYEKIECLYRDRIKLKEVAHNAKFTIENKFNINFTVDKLINLYKKI